MKVASLGSDNCELELLLLFCAYLYVYVHVSMNIILVTYGALQVLYRIVLYCICWNDSWTAVNAITTRQYIYQLNFSIFGGA